MKNLILLTFFLAFVLVQAQELDENFLDSLPDDVREDLVNRAGENTESAKENYRPSQYSSK